MASTKNGHSGGNGHHVPRWSTADLVPRPAPPSEKGVSGSRFVMAGVIVILLGWGGVYLGFRAWRANYESLAEYGATQIAPLVDPLANRLPPDVDQTEWQKAVSDTHGMLVALTAAGLLDRPTLEALRAEVAELVVKATPTTVRADLTEFWDKLERRAGPVISSDVTPARPGSRYENRHPRPPRPAILMRSVDVRNSTTSNHQTQ